MELQAIDILKKCTVEGHTIKLPPGQLDKKLYDEVAKRLKKIGGSWKGGKVYGFVFKQDPTELLAEIAGGADRNIKKEFQFFPTPKKVALNMIRNYAFIEDGMSILEPSAGQGDLIEAIYEEYPHYMKGPNDKPSVTVAYYELMPLNAKVLSDKIHQHGVSWSSRTSCMGEDFMRANPPSSYTYADNYYYDRIIANPPFTKNQDIDHIRHMWGFLKPGGRIVTLASPAWQEGSHKKQVEFREWLEQLGAEIYPVEKGAFRQSGTEISTVIIVIDKPR